MQTMPAREWFQISPGNCQLSLSFLRIVICPLGLQWHLRQLKCPGLWHQMQGRGADAVHTVVCVMNSLSPPLTEMATLLSVLKTVFYQSQLSTPQEAGGTKRSPLVESIKWVCRLRQLGWVVFGFHLPRVKMYPSSLAQLVLQGRRDFPISNSRVFVGRAGPGYSVVKTSNI